MHSGGHVDGHASGWTELRVHGVAGTPPTAVLEHPHVTRVAGYAQAGFFRRWWEARSVSADTERHRTEAYSWGGLTSGDNTRALWLLLLPFMLLNVAFFMAPSRRPPDPPAPPGSGAPAELPPELRAARRRDRFSSAVQRLLALSFTATFTLTAVTVAMDLVGWQCAAGRTGDDVCGTSWLGWLAWSWLDRPGRQLAVTALLPLAVVGLLWWLARTTWRNLEAVEVAQTVDDAALDLATPLEDRALWNGRAAVRRLRSVHVATGLALPGVAALAPFGPGDPLGALTSWPRVAVLVPLLGLLVLAVVQAAGPTTGRRTRGTADADAARREREQQERAERTDRYRVLPWVALGLTVLALGFAATTPVPVRPVGTLPWLVGAVQWLFVGQAVLLVLLLVACLLLRRHPDRSAAPSCGPDGVPVAVAPAWRGLAMPGVALLAWVLAGGFSAGVILRAAQTLGTPVARGQRSGAAHPIVVPTAYTWVAVGALVLGLVAAASAAVAWWRIRGRSAEFAASVRAVDAAYADAAPAGDGAGGAEYRARRDAIARAWTEARTLSREAQRASGFLLVVTVLVVAGGAVGFLTVGPRLLTAWPGLVTAANLAISAFVVGLVGLGRQAYRSAATRRTVGILWDLGTFWPRAVHPLAPPCYAERAVPDLLLRLRHYAASDGRVLLSCHSQGSVLGAAVLLQLETAVSARTAFLTYGSPLARLYGGFFPAYFGHRALARLGGFLAGPPRRPAAGPGDRAAWRWRNLYRPSDPVGGAVFCPRDPSPPGVPRPQDVDVVLRDPVFARPPGDPCHPPVLGHSDYLADPVVDATAAALRAGLPDGRGVTGDRPAPPPVAGGPRGADGCGPGRAAPR